MDLISVTSYLPTVAYSLLAVFFTTLIAAYYYVETSRAVRFSKKLPSPPHLPIIGHGLLFYGISPNKMLEITVEYARQCGPVISGYFGTKVFIALTDAEDIEAILSSPVHINKPLEYQFFQPWLGDGLLINTGSKWRRHRKIIAPTFHISILKTFVPLFYENSIDLVRRLRNEVGKEFDCHDYLSAVMVDILTETVMGVKLEKKQKTGHEYAVAVMKMCDITHRRHYDPLLRLSLLFKLSKTAKIQRKLIDTIHTLTDHIIQKKSEDFDEKLANGQQQKLIQSNKLTENSRAGNIKNNNYMKLHYARDDLDDIDEYDVGEKKRLAFLEMMIDLKKNSGKMTDEEIKEEVNTIMFEGHDTTAAGSSFALCILGCRQDIQSRVQEELDNIFGDSDRQCTFQDTLEMKYLERVILETLRFFPPVPLIARELTEDVQIVTGNYILPKGATIMIAQFGVHRSEKYYSNPLVFDPDNFLPERMQQRHYYAYIPFSAGPRSCVGRKYAMLKLKVLLSTILRNYRITSDITENDFPLRGDIILKRSDGFKIKIESRKSASQQTV